MEDRQLSLSEVAGLMGVSERTVRRWIKSGMLRAFKPGRDYRIPESAVRDLVKRSEISPKAGRRSSLEPMLFNGLEEERRAKLAELESFVRYAVRRAEYWELEFERARAEEGVTAESAARLAVMALQEFMSIMVWLFDEGPARPLYQAMEQGVGLEIEEDYDALITKLIERTARTQRTLFANAERLAETEAQRNEIAARRREAETALNASFEERSA
jgi:excisionase family DNA binding protein